MNGGYVMISIGGLEITGNHGSVTVNGTYNEVLKAIRDNKPIILCDGTIEDTYNNIRNLSPIPVFGYEDGDNSITFPTRVSYINVTVNDVWFII